MESASSPAWSREFNRGKTTNWVLLGIPAFLIFGAIFYFGAGNFHRTQFQVVGIIAAVVGPSVCFWIWRSAESTCLVCGPEGFRTEITSRSKGTRQEAYRWNEVTATVIWVTKTEWKDDLPTYFQHFAVETARGQAFAYNDGIRCFREVVDLCNAMTTHLPYVWLPRPSGQDWEYVPAPQVLSGQLRPVTAAAKFFCSSRQPNIAPPAPPSAAPPPVPPPMPMTTVPPSLPTTL